MTTTAHFYVLAANAETEPTQSAHFDLAARTVAQQYRQGERVFVYVDDVSQAHAFDELLWQFDADSFVPHNLQGEGPKGGAAVEIGQTPPVGRRTVLLNLATKLPDFIRRFNHVIDFVPVESAAKQAARERFKALRAMGASITTTEISQ
ncbi:DNA polymerase III subunit chi [Pseudoalteromonas fenneropenaei]|uniref:DNA polymerase III subunit chi n=1 Tax=Pseudoalteromonas fenneropenaei TaxID=1737459 RepID=A0ABV7CKM1_9GAMM